MNKQAKNETKDIEAYKNSKGYQLWLRGWTYKKDMRPSTLKG